MVVLIAMQLARRLPEGLLVRTEERVALAETERTYFADVAMLDSLRRETQSSRVQETAVGTAVFTEPIIVIAEPETERWVEIRDANGRLVTVIEVLSPTNKSDQGWQDYQRKQHDFLSAGVNFGRNRPHPRWPAHGGRSLRRVRTPLRHQLRDLRRPAAAWVHDPSGGLSLPSAGASSDHSRSVARG
jgi:hypothetical protein